MRPIYEGGSIEAQQVEMGNKAQTLVPDLRTHGEYPWDQGWAGIWSKQMHLTIDQAYSFMREAVLYHLENNPEDEKLFRFPRISEFNQNFTNKMFRIVRGDIASDVYHYLWAIYRQDGKWLLLRCRADDYERVSQARDAYLKVPPNRPIWPEEF
jgi:hypothetical protein